MWKPMLAPLQIEGLRTGGQQTVGRAKSGLLPVSGDAVSQEQSQGHSFRCCAWLLSHCARGGELQ